MRTLPLALALLTLSGCAQPDPAAAPAQPLEGPAPPASTSEWDLWGHVLTPALAPVPGAAVTLLAVDTVATGASGEFRFPGLEANLHTLVVAADGFRTANVTVAPDAPMPVQVVLDPLPPPGPFQETYLLRGHIECAAETVIITPSCDSVLTAVPGAPRVFAENQSLVFDAGETWRTVVADVSFDGDAHPGLDGLRLTVRGAIDPDANGSYQQYGKWHGPDAFTARLEPGGAYAEGTHPVPVGRTTFKMDVYPHGHGYRPGQGGEGGTLGVGAALQVRFDLVVTVFHNVAAPAGYTALQGEVRP